MAQPSPLRTIEVIDANTGNTYKVACMSCIRGHRTTSCGKNVCRSKVFWTVKRPGRPANTCTCPLGSTGRCQCVIATASCPHRAKKGESRSVDCRCGEQGRLCCVLSPDNWRTLMAGKTPKVDVYPTPEAMAGVRTTSTNISFPSTPSLSAATPQSAGGTTPQAMSSLPSTPGPVPGAQLTNMNVSPLSNYQPPQYQAPRFGLMGVGTPLGGEGYQGQDVLKWQGQAPQAPRELRPYPPFDVASTVLPNSAPLDSAPNLQMPYMNALDQQYQNPDFAPVTQSLQDMTMQSQEPTPGQLQRDKLMEDYYNFQFPSAICQNCGLSGCNCRSCPAVMQSSIDGSWAQCCSRKHVRTAELAQRGIVQSSVALEHQDLPPLLQTGNPILNSDGQDYAMTGLTPSGDELLSSTFDLNSLDDLRIPTSGDPMDFNEFVLTDPELPSHGCCCGGDT